MCGKCEKKKRIDLNDYTVKIFRIRHLKIAGYQYRPDDLSIEEWDDLGSVEDLMKERSEMKLRDLLLEGICAAFNRGRS